MIGLIYQYYYGGGDTMNYYLHGHVVNSALSESFTKWLALITHTASSVDGDFYTNYTSKMQWYDASTEYAVVIVTALLGLVNFTTYLPISILFGSFAFTGLWALFRTFATRYPALTKQIAWCTLFIPSTVMWGSGIFKDTICMCALGWLTYGVFRVLLLRDFKFKNVAVVVFSFYIISVIKVYILLAFIPALFLWILFSYSHKIGNAMTRKLVTVLTVFVCIGGFVFFSQKFAADLGKYSLENIGQTSYVTSTYIASVSGDEGSAYDIGIVDPSPAGLLRIFPAAVNVSLFRPYIWETRKVIQLLNAVEASLFLWVTLKIIFRLGFKRAWRAISGDPTIQFALIFTIIFAFAVGMSSGNFGALSRYRIPCLPFFGIALVLIYYKYNPPEKNILSLR